MPKESQHRSPAWHAVAREGLEDGVHGFTGCVNFQARIGAGPSAELFAREFLAGIQRINYNQGNGLNALAGL